MKAGKHTVTAITRPDSKSKLPDGIKVVPVDYDDHSALVAALKGQQFFIITMAATAPPETQSKLLKAAAEARVPYVMPNWYGGNYKNETLARDTMYGDRWKRLETEMESLGIPYWMAIVCGFWYEFSLGGGPVRYGFDINKRTVVLFDEGTTAINTTTWTQIGRAMVNLLSLKELPDDQDDHSLTLNHFSKGQVRISSFRISQRDMFESIKRVTGTTDSDWTITKEPSLDRWKDGIEAVKKGDMTGFGKLLYTRVFFPNGDGDYESSEGLHNHLLGLPEEDLDEATKLGVYIGENKLYTS